MEKIQIERGPEQLEFFASLALGDKCSIVMWLKGDTPSRILIRSISRKVGSGGGFDFNGFQTDESYRRIIGHYRTDTRTGWISTSLKAE